MNRSGMRKLLSLSAGAAAALLGACGYECVPTEGGCDLVKADIAQLRIVPDADSIRLAVGATQEIRFMLLDHEGNQVHPWFVDVYHGNSAPAVLRFARDSAGDHFDGTGLSPGYATVRLRVESARDSVVFVVLPATAP